MGSLLLFNFLNSVSYYSIKYLQVHINYNHKNKQLKIYKLKTMFDCYLNKLLLIIQLFHQ